MPFYFIVVVWGDDYVDMLLQVSLRCFLSPNNIPALSDLSSARFIFVAEKQDYAKITAAKIYEKLTTYVQPVFIELTVAADESKYVTVTKGFEAATKFVIANQACAVYLLPDCLISDGTLFNLEQYAKQGRDVVLLPGPRVIKEDIISYVRELALQEGDALTLAPRKLANLGLRCLHPEFKLYNFTSAGFTKWPHMVTWNIPNHNGLLIRAFHLHPLLVNYSKLASPVNFQATDTIDGHFLKNNFHDLNKYLWETDSDKLILFSMTLASERVEAGLIWNDKAKLVAIADMAWSNPMINELHKIHFYNAYKLHDAAIDAVWAVTEKESFTLVGEILRPQKFNKMRMFYLMGRRLILKLLPLKLKNKLRHIYWLTKDRLGSYGH